MRKSSWAVVALLVSVFGTGSALGQSRGFVANPNACHLADLLHGELIVARAHVPASDDTDLLFALWGKGGRSTDWRTNYDVAGSWAAGSAFRGPCSGGLFVLMMLPPRGSELGCRLFVDSSGCPVVDLGVADTRRVGDSVPAGVDAGIGLTIPGTRATYPVVIAGVVRDFPERDGDGAVRLAFAPVPEVNPNAIGSGCTTVGGDIPDPSDPAPNDMPPVAGRIIGYNVYRIPACSATLGRQAEFARALVDASPRTGWIGFVDLRRFRLSVPHDGAVSPGPNDLDPSDSVELVNPDGRMYSGDEVVIFTDEPAASRPDPLRAPRPDQAYMYAVQPVWRGTMDEYANVGFTNADVFHGDHRRDLDRDGSFDAVDLDLSTVGGVEFISPQHEPENGSLDGMGLTLGGMPLLSAPMHAAAVVPARFPPECILLPRP